jgi:hypothetical protein
VRDSLAALVATRINANDLAEKALSAELQSLLVAAGRVIGFLTGLAARV